MSGILIAIEGIDGAGKTTQAKILADALASAGEEVVTSKEPTDGQWGQKLRESAQNGRMSIDDELHAFVEDRKEHISNLIGPSLEQGKMVILDRYFYSTIAYQGARGKDTDELNELMRSFAIIPDVAFLIDVQPAVGISRISESRGETPNEFEKLEDLQKVRSIFNQLLGGEIAFVDGHQDIAGVQSQIASRLLDGPLKAKRCAKPWGCDGFYCSYRVSGECKWAKLYSALHSSSVASSCP
jgi:dTMP kinase